MPHVAFRATDDEAAALDEIAAAKGFANRSQALRSLISASDTQQTVVVAPQNDLDGALSELWVVARNHQAPEGPRVAALKRLVDHYEKREASVEDKVKDAFEALDAIVGG